VVLMILQGRWQLAFLCFVVVGVSDAVDGFIAKRFDMRTELGAYIDPLADKALLVSIYVTLSAVGAIPVWLVILVVFRDLMIVTAIMLSWLLERPVEIKPLMVSKLNTGAQIVLAAMLLGSRAFGVDLHVTEDVAVVAVAALTTASAGAYLASWLSHMTASDDDRV
jgi:cardiolipin synthase